MLDQRGDITCDESHRMNFVEAVTNNLPIQNTEECLVIDAPGVHVEVNAFVPEWQLKMVLEGLKHA